jgi:hypothetical protein
MSETTQFEHLVRLLQRDGARLIKTACDDGITRWSVYPFGVAVHPRTAARIISRPDVHGCRDGLLPDCDQTFAFVASGVRH